MNRIFSKTGEGWPVPLPGIFYARLDQIEPLDPFVEGEGLFAFDAVDGSWSAFGPGGVFDLSDAGRLVARQRLYWSDMFGAVGSRPADLYDSAPIFRIEITARRGDDFFDFLCHLKETDWVKIDLDAVGNFSVDIYGGLFAAPALAYLTQISLEAILAPALSAVFDMDLWPEADENELKATLSGVADLEYLIAYDIGQGSANGLADRHKIVRLYFDLGCGVYGNRATRPVPLSFCWRAGPTIVLSHWDTDHWAGETCDPSASGRVWVAPQQSIGPTHAAFAARILAAGGSIHIWARSSVSPASIAVVLASGQTLKFARASGSSRNGSGIYCAVSGSAGSNGWLLTGDAPYHRLNAFPLPQDLRAVVAPHHGADMGPASVPPTRVSGYGRLFYSFGPGNTHGKTKVRHPTPAGVSAHISSGWGHGGWTTASPATCVAGGDVLATASHAATHLDSAVAAWTAAPAIPFSSPRCQGSPPCPSACTLLVSQS